MILVTGASGLLGASVVMVAQEQRREVTGLYHRHAVTLPGAALVSADLTDESDIRKVFHDLKPESVVHCAAATSVDWCQRHPEEAYRANVDVSARIAEIAAQEGMQLLYISTDSVFDGVRGYYSEADVPAPVNVYAQTKLRGEEKVLGSHSSAAVARVTLYGWNAQNKQSLAEWVLSELALGKPVPGFTDSIFCPILANDLAKVLLAMVDSKLTGIYHVVGCEAVSKYEFARQIAIKFAFDPRNVFPTLTKDSNLSSPRPRVTSLNTRKICAALGHSMPNVAAGLDRFIRLQPSGYAERLRRQVPRAQG